MDEETMIEIAQAFKRGQMSVRVSMWGPGISDRGPVYFFGIGAEGRIVLDKEKIFEWINFANTNDQWPIEWVMKIEEDLRLPYMDILRDKEK